MKNLLFSVSFLLTAAIATTSCEKEEVVSPEELPAEGQTFLSDHFAGLNVVRVEKEKDRSEGTEYEARLENGVVVKFDKNGNWDDVDAPANAALPTSFILTPVVEYLAAEYPDTEINEIDKEPHGFDVELTNGLDLEFDAEGQFIRIDP